MEHKFILLIVLIMSLGHCYSQSIYHRNGPIYVHYEDLVIASDTVCGIMGFEFTSDNQGEIFFTVNEFEGPLGNDVYRIRKFDKFSNEELFLEIDYTSECNGFAGGLESISLVKDKYLLIFGSRKIVVVDVETKSFDFIEQPTFNGRFVTVSGCFECMGTIFCNSIEGIGTQRIWKYDTESMVFDDPFTISLGLGFSVEYGCVGQSREFARLITKADDIIRAYPWDGPFFPIYSNEYEINFDLCGAPFGFEVKNHTFQLLAKNDLGLTTDRDVALDLPFCDSDNISIADIKLDLDNEGGPVDSISFHLMSAPVDSYLNFDSQEIDVVGNVSDSVIIYNTAQLSDLDFFAAVNQGFISIINTVGLETLVLELRAYDFLNIDGKTIHLNLIDESPCDTDTEDLSTETYQLFPNPVQDQLFIDSDLIGSFYKLYDIRGKVISNGTLKNRLGVSELISGVYLIEINKAKSQFPFIFSFVKS